MNIASATTAAFANKRMPGECLIINDDVLGLNVITNAVALKLTHACKYTKWAVPAVYSPIGV